jgi:glucose/arabinose dehydrogenase
MNCISVLVRGLATFAAACSLLFAGTGHATTLVTVLSGLTSPIFAGHAGDGSNRLFIVEQAGVIKVLQPGGSTASVFLDINAKVLDGGERGLLGLAFHPAYETNGRFFVYYTRDPDGAIVLAEYRDSANTNVAATTETVLFTIDHPNTNHNGGMLAFGPDGYLYIGVGDGGGANDPPNNAQNINVPLGKILRIDVDHPDLANGLNYSSPADNPYAGAIAGLDEIYAIGWRNPWRFSFDRSTGAQWVADVGQGAREEVDAPIVKGGNYGWRVYEGSACSGNDPTLCNAANYIFPIFDYTHLNGRCSITGGYVYRGSQGALPTGTYVYGDYCTGEILTWNGAAQSVLMDTTMNISSFGEDEAGELYVVNLGGTLSKLVSSTPPPTCTYTIAPASAQFGAASAMGSITVSAPAGCAWTATSNASWLTITGVSGTAGNGTVTYSVATYTGNPKRRTGTLTVAERTFTVTQTKAR